MPLLFVVIVAVALRQAERSLGWQPLVAATLTTAVDRDRRGLPFYVQRATQRRDRLSLLQSQPGAQSCSGAVPAAFLVAALRRARLPSSPGSCRCSSSRSPSCSPPGWSSPVRGWAGRRTERGSGIWRADPAGEAALVQDVSRTDATGAGEFLQAQLESSGPFRYAGYGGYGYPGDEARRDSYMGRRFEPAITALLVNGRPIYLGLYDIQGYNPLHLSRYDEFMTALNGATTGLPHGLSAPLRTALAAARSARRPLHRPGRHVATLSGRRAGLHAETRVVFRTPRVIVHERDSAPPHAWIVHDVRSVTRGEALPLLTSGAIDPYQTALVEGAAPVTAVPDEPAAESARVTAYEPDRLTIATQAAAPGLLVVSEVYQSGWRAYVDGAEVAILPTHHALRGIPIPSGEHTVELRYDPLSLRLGLWISGIVTAAMVVVFLIAGWSWLSGRIRRVG